MPTNIDISNMEEYNEQTISDISNLQQIEQDLYNSLETNANSNTLTVDQKTQIISKINQISQMKINLYDNLKNNYVFLKDNVASSRITLDEQIIAIDIVENELQQAKKRLQLLEDDKYNKLRQVEINTYYGKKYNSHTDVMKIIVFMCIPILIVSFIANMGILPDGLYFWSIIVIISIGVICICYKLIDNSTRDNMNYDEYDWGFDSSKAPTNNNTNATNPWTIPSLECYGPGCCINGQSIYDPRQNKCVPIASCNNPTSTSTSTSTNTSTSTSTNTSSYNLIGSLASSSTNLLDSLTNSLRTESFRTGGNNYLPKLGYSELE
jgi:hypothetical protein